MKPHDLFEIVYLLLDKKQLSARELAEHFEVSTRTIYRWIEQLCIAGVPIIAMQGKGGGISIMDGYVLDKAVLSEEEKQSIVSSLQGLKALSPTGEEDEAVDSVITKLGGIFNNWIEVDFSSWSSSTENKEIFENIKNGILGKHPVSFEYFGGRGAKTDRVVEPFRLVFKQQSWYMFGFCRLRNENRYFKLSRIKNLKLLDESFSRTFTKSALVDSNSYYSKQNKIKIQAKINANFMFQAYDQFREQIVKTLPDGGCIVEFEADDNEWLVFYILSFGSNMEILKPENLRTKIIQVVKDTCKQYGLNSN